MSYFVPREPQKLMINFGMNLNRANLFASPGTGKTSASIGLFDMLRTFGSANRALIIAPRRVALSTWPNEFVKWKETFGHLSCAAAIGNQSERIAAISRNTDVTTINYDNIPWLVERWGSDWPYDTVFADESPRLKGLRVSLQKSKTGKTFLKGQGSSRAKALARVAHTRVRNWYNLSGSPASNGLEDVWGQQWFVDAGQRLGNSFSAYSDRFFRAVPGGDGYSKIELMPFSEQRINALLKETSIYIDAKDYYPIGKVHEQIGYVDMPSKARDQYNQMQRELFTFIQEHPIEAVSQGVKSQKCLQIASGTVKISEKEWLNVHDEKLEQLESWMEELYGRCVLVSYNFRADREKIKKAFKYCRDLDDGKHIEQDFRDGKIRMLLVHPASAGHGLDLQHNCCDLIDYSSGFNLEYDEQVIERIGPTRQFQINSNKLVTRRRIIARNTIEESVVLPRLASKMSLQDAFKNAMKREGSHAF